jgi:hypothetical protein
VPGLPEAVIREAYWHEVSSAGFCIRTVVLSVVSRIDCLPWHVSYCSDRRCLIRTLADLPHNGGHYSKRAKTSRGHGEVSLFGRSLAIFSTALCSTRRRRARHRWDALRPDKHLAVMARRSGQGMKPRAAQRLRASLDRSEHHDTP